MTTAVHVFLVISTLFFGGHADFPFRDVTLSWDKRVDDLVCILLNSKLNKLFNTHITDICFGIFFLINVFQFHQWFIKSIRTL